MGITQHGPRCDICGKYILPIDPEERVNFFKDENFERELIADNECKAIVKEGNGKWWTLPDGPYKEAYKGIHERYEGHCNLGPCPVCDKKILNDKEVPLGASL